MLQKLALAGFGLLAVVMAAASPAAAQYGPDLGSSTSVVRPGEAFTLTGSGFPAGVEVTLTLLVAGAPTARAVPDEGIVLGVVTSAPDGTFATEVTLPASVDPGRYVIRAQHEDVVAETGIEVAATRGETPPGGGESPAGGGAPAPDGSLPRTGADLSPYTLIGACLLAGGGVVLLVTRDRQRADVAA